MAYYSNMLLVTTSVLSDCKFLLPWTIAQFSDSCSVLEFFDETFKPQLDDNCFLHSVYVGKESIYWIL